MFSSRRTHFVVAVVMQFSVASHVPFKRAKHPARYRSSAFMVADFMGNFRLGIVERNKSWGLLGPAGATVSPVACASIEESLEGAKR